MVRIVSIELIIVVTGAVLICCQTQDRKTLDPVESKTICKIVAGDVEATAEATLSRNIEGVCTSDEFQSRLDDIEKKIMQELYSIRHMIARSLNIDPNFNVPLPEHMYPTALVDSVISTPSPPVQLSTLQYNKDADDAIHFPKEDVNAFETESNKMLSLKSIDTNRKVNTTIRIRDKEVHTFNNTMLKAGESKIFTYFWKLENFSANIMKNEHHITSPVFTISGLNLRIVVTINYMGRDFTNIRIERVYDNFMRNKSAISLETGHLFQPIEEKKKFKHKIIILDHETPATDLISQDFWDTNLGFQIPTSTLNTSRYVKNDSLFIRVAIYI